jgi:hypothetical protein
MDVHDARYPAPPEGVQRLSQSLIESYLRCGYRWFLRRGEKTRRTTVPISIGVGVARGAAHALRGKAKGSSVPIADVRDLAVSAYDADVAAAEESAREIAIGRDRAASAAETFCLRVEPQITGIEAVEQPVCAQLSPALELVGTPDYVTEGGVGDLKTGQPWTQDRADGARQLTAYSILYYAQHQRMPRAVWIDSIGHAGKRWAAERLWSARTEAQLRAYMALMVRTADAIKAGIALPASESEWSCNARWCPYFGRQCEFTRR